MIVVVIWEIDLDFLKFHFHSIVTMVGIETLDLLK